MLTFFYKKEPLQHKIHNLQTKEKLDRFTCSAYSELILCGKRDKIFSDTSALIPDSMAESEKEDGQRETCNNICQLESNLQHTRVYVAILYTENMRFLLSKQEQIIQR